MRREQATLQLALHDVQRHTAAAMELAAGLPMEQFVTDARTVAAVAYHAIVAGEAANRALQVGYRIEETELVDYLQRARLARNEFTHKYDVMEPDNLFVTIEIVYVPLNRLVRAYLGSQPPASDTVVPSPS